MPRDAGTAWFEIDRSTSMNPCLTPIRTTTMPAQVTGAAFTLSWGIGAEMAEESGLVDLILLWGSVAAAGVSLLVLARGIIRELGPREFVSRREMKRIARKAHRRPRSISTGGRAPGLRVSSTPHLEALGDAEAVGKAPDAPASSDLARTRAEEELDGALHPVTMPPLGGTPSNEIPSQITVTVHSSPQREVSFLVEADPEQKFEVVELARNTVGPLIPDRLHDLSLGRFRSWSMAILKAEAARQACRRSNERQDRWFFIRDVRSNRVLWVAEGTALQSKIIDLRDQSAADVPRSRNGRAKTSTLQSADDLDVENQPSV